MGKGNFEESNIINTGFIDTDNFEKSFNNESNSDLEKVTEEFYGLEYEEVDDIDVDRFREHPFDADKIRIEQQMLSLKYIYDLMEENKIIRPEFQRNRVWTERRRKSLLIESLMLRIPIPAFYFYENEESDYIVIDGLQRLSTIQEFINNGFKLSGLEYLENNCGGRNFSELDMKYQQRIYRTQLAVNILDARSPFNVILDIFRRVNTGGMSLKPQEIRNALAKSKTRQFLKMLYSSSEFQKATRGKVRDDRMDGQELVLRFIAFYKAYNFKDKTVNYNSGDIAVFLDSALQDLNKATHAELSEYEKAFKRAMNFSLRLFREYTFRKCYVYENGNGVYSNIDIINKALYTSWAVILSDPSLEESLIEVLESKMLYKLAEYLTIDYNYNTCLTQGTNSTRSIKYSFYKANEILKEALQDA